MTIPHKRETFLLFLGDTIIFLSSLWITLLVRYLRIPSEHLFFQHLLPFLILFVVWIVVFFIAGLYEKHTILLQSKLPGTLLNVQIINSIIAVLFFYFIPFFSITPKTNLFIYLSVSSLLFAAWRIYGYPVFSLQRKQSAMLIASGKEMKELQQEVDNNKRYEFQFMVLVDLSKVAVYDFKRDILNPLYENNIHAVVIDIQDERIEALLPHLYNLIFSKIRFIDMHTIYEDIFDRIPLSLLRYNWFLENISTKPQFFYDTLKRIMDVVLASFLGAVSLLVYPFIWIAIKLDDNGSLFFTQDRIGKNNKIIHIYKFRSMSEESVFGKQSHTDVTRVGKILRKSRIDELPQLWNVIRGDLSMIGPRPEIPFFVDQYKKEIPYYNIRHLIKPGLSGWAQLYHDTHSHHQSSVDQTKIKLSYDLYYIKNRSFILDIKIALKTLKKLISRSGI